MPNIDKDLQKHLRAQQAAHNMAVLKASVLSQTAAPIYGSLLGAELMVELLAQRDKAADSKTNGKSGGLSLNMNTPLLMALYGAKLLLAESGMPGFEKPKKPE